nr:phospholipase domain-containing protein [Nocardia tengchongensis]
MRYGNQGSVPMPFQTFAYHVNSIRQTVVPPGVTAEERFQISGSYDFAVHAPNGFLAEAAGSADTAALTATAAIGGTTSTPTFVVTVRNSGSSAVTVEVSGGSRATVDAGATHDFTAPLDDGWYDLTLTVSGNTNWRRHFAGHLENGSSSTTAQ